jgi:hypothetical protein
VAAHETTRNLKETRVEIRVRLPQVPAGLGANLLGLLGLVGMALAVGGLTGNWWWSALVGGLFAFGLAWVAQTQAVPAEAAAVVPVPAVPVEDPARAALEEQTREVAYMRGLKPA